MRQYLTNKQVLAIYAATGTRRVIGREYGISDSHVGRIKRGEVHAGITSTAPAPPETKPQGVSPPLSSSVVQQILEHPGSIRVAARELGLAVGTVRKYRKRAREQLAFCAPKKQAGS